jgi:hypothetical protein
MLSSSTSSLVSSFPISKGRKYSLDWKITFPWLRYSVTENSAYCAYCLVFGDGEGLFRTVGFNDWKNAIGEKRGTFKIHEKSKTHVSSMEKADNLVMISREKKLDINRFISKPYEEKVSRNRQIYLLSLTLSLYLGKKI